MTEPEPLGYDADIWIVYREYHIGNGQYAKKAEAIFSRESKAIDYMKWMRNNLDTKFGISWQGWDLDDNWTADSA